jgi:uncharacterized protein
VRELKKNLPVNTKRRLSRRDFIKLLTVAGLAGLDAVLVAQGGSDYVRKVEPLLVEVTQVRLKLPRLPKSFSGFRLAQISDMHLGGWMTVSHAADLFKMVLDQSPDAVAMTGDFVMAYGRGHDVLGKMDEIIPVLEEMTRQVPVMAVLGNHDHRYDSVAVTEMLQQAGVGVLNNAVSAIWRGEDTLNFAGVDDVMEGKDRLEQVLAQLPSESCSILLAHEPDFADSSSATGRFDLQISGHSHGGQVVLPLIGPPVLPEFGQKYPSGLYQVGNMFQYTNRGVGMTLPYVRLNCRPEITVFTLESTLA